MVFIGDEKKKNGKYTSNNIVAKQTNEKRKDTWTNVSYETKSGSARVFGYTVYQGF